MVFAFIHSSFLTSCIPTHCHISLSHTLFFLSFALPFTFYQILTSKLYGFNEFVYPVDQIPFNEIGNSVVTPTNELKENKRRKLVKKAFAVRQLNGNIVDVFRIARKLNLSAKVEYTQPITPLQTHLKRKKQFDRQIKADNGKCCNYFTPSCILQSVLL